MRLKVLLMTAGLICGGLLAYGAFSARYGLTPVEADDAPAAPAAQERAAPMAETTQEHRALTPEEEYVIVNKGTERPFTGQYNDFFENGVYACRRCGAMLYRSQDKFKAHCGWPAFDDGIHGAVTRVPDADGQRIEITCANCGGHLGHVFEGEQLTEKNTRHCVNSISLQFVPEVQVKYGRAIFAGGCFWGVEYWFEQVPGVLAATSGYIGGSKPEPTYEEVCRHTTGHAEAVEVLYDPVRVSFEQLARLFFEIHDSTQVNRQGPDIGDQYRSEIFVLDETQQAIAAKLIAELTGRGMAVATKVTPAAQFWAAEEYHQDYYARKRGTPYCHMRKKLW